MSVKIENKKTNSSRRNFIKTTALASFSISPIAGLLANNLNNEDLELQKKLAEAFNNNPDFYIIDNNLINLHFYFIGVKRKGKEIRKLSSKTKAFMIVKLPQMHVSEQGFFKEVERAKAKMSGFSFLAFEIKQNFIFNRENVLNWNSPKLELVTLTEWIKVKSKKTHLSVEDYEKALSFKGYVKGEMNNKFYESKSSLNAFENYKNKVSQFLEQKNNDFIPITLLEIPEALCLVPLNRRKIDVQEEGIEDTMITSSSVFGKNSYVNQDKHHIKERKYEVWNTSFNFQTEIESVDRSQNGIEIKEKVVFIDTPSFRAIGVIGNPSDFRDVSPCSDKKVSSEEHKNDCENQKETNFLPTLLDKTELAFLTQYAKDQKQHDFTSKEFDIKEQNGLLFTGLGVITHLKYYNLDLLPNEVDLIEYEHKITQGRDVYIKVARLGYNVKTGQRYKHIIEGKRRVNQDAVSFIELKQYCLCIDLEIEYQKEGVKNPIEEQYHGITKNQKLSNEIYSNLQAKLDYKRFPFKKITTIENEKIPIKCLQADVQLLDVCKNQKLYWFWPVHENVNLKSAKDVTIDEYVNVSFTAEDWQGNTVNGSTPFQFVRKSAIIDLEEKLKSEIYSSFFKHVSGPLIERRKTYFKKQKINFLSIKPSENEPKNDATFLETEFIETYFRVKKVSCDDAVRIVNQNYVIYPQLLRAKVYLDHVKDVTLQEIPSVLEYHNSYISHGLKTVPIVVKEKNKDGSEKIRNTNPGKLILANTEAFINGTEEKINNQYKKIGKEIANAKDRLGNLAIGDNPIDTISLSKFGTTLPKEINKAIEAGNTLLDVDGTIKSFNPRALLRGKLNEICGLDLTLLLDEIIPESESPLYQVADKAGDIYKDLSQDVLDSQVYKDFMSSMKIAVDDLKDLKKEYDNLYEGIDELRKEYNKGIDKLARELPDIERFKKLVRAQFEKEKLKAIKDIEDFQFHYNDVLKNKIENLRGKLETDIAKTIKRKIPEVKEYTENILSGFSSVFRQFNELKNKYSEYSDPLNKIEKCIISVQSTLEIDLEKRFQLQIDDFKNVKFQAGVTIKKIIGESKKVNSKFQENLDDAFSFVEEAVLNQLYYFDETTFEIIRNTKSAGIKIEQIKDKDVSKAGYFQLEKKVADFQKIIIANQGSTNDEIKNLLKLLKSKVKKYNDSIINKKTSFTSKIKLDYYEYRDQIDENIKFIEANLQLKKELSSLIGNMDTYVSSFFNFMENIDVTRYVEKFNKYKTEYEVLLDQVEGGTLDFVDKIKKDLDEKAKEINTAINVEYDKYNKFIDEKLKGQLNKIEIAEFKSINEEYEKLIQRLIKGEEPLIKAIEKYAEKQIEELLKNNDFYIKYNESLKKTKKELESTLENQKIFLQSYEEKLKEKAKTVEEGLEGAYKKFLKTNEGDVKKIKEAQRIYKLLKSLRKKDLTYKWNTNKFSDTNFGFINFQKMSNPDTRLSIDVKSTTHFKPNKFPPQIDRVEGNAVNKFENFRLDIFDSILVDFSEVSFESKVGGKSKFDVQIQDVKFQGVLSFIEVFEQHMKTLGQGFILEKHKDHLSLVYSMPLPPIESPSFSFTNATINMELKVYYDNIPLQFGFALGRKNSKFQLSVGAYAGFGYFGIVVNPKDGIVELDTALEAGAYSQIRLGPIRGEVKLVFGFYFKKGNGVTILEGYFIAEGRLSVWIIRAHARIKLAIRSVNGSIVGYGTVTLSIKLAFKTKKFRGSYKKVMRKSSTNGVSGNKILNKESTKEKAVFERTNDENWEKFIELF